jgi:hypothetical protein
MPPVIIIRTISILDYYHIPIQILPCTIMFSNLIWALLAVLSLVHGYLVSLPGTAAPGTTDDCSEWIEYSSSLTCALIEQYFGMTEAEFEAWVSQLAPFQ